MGFFDSIGDVVSGVTDFVGGIGGGGLGAGGNMLGGGGGGMLGGLMGGGGLPQTGLQQQSYQGPGIIPGGGKMQTTGGSGNTIQQMAQNLAQRYGIAVGNQQVVDESGNFMFTPNQAAVSSGMRPGDAAAAMGQISQALATRQNQEQQAQAQATLEQSIGQVQSRGRGSMAAAQSGQFGQLAAQQAGQQYGQQDFSYYIAREMTDQQAALMQQQQEMAQQQAQFGMIGGLLMGGAGMMTGNPMLALGGVGMATGNAAGTGWF
jgi:hypothetical protein